MKKIALLSALLYACICILHAQEDTLTEKTLG